MKRFITALGAPCALLGVSVALAQSMPVQQIDVVEPARLGLAADREAMISEQAISADGRWVVFRSAAGNLVDGDDNQRDDIFLLDRERDALTRITQDILHPELQGHTHAFSLPVISADGRWVFFGAAGTPDPGRPGLFGPSTTPFRYSIETGQAEPIISSTHLWRFERVSRDGRYTLVRGGDNALLWLRLDLQTGDTVLVSQDMDGQPTGGIAAALSPSGRFACFVSADEDVGVMLIDLDGELAMQRVDVTARGLFGAEHHAHCVPSDDGERVAFVSDSLLVPRLPLRTRVYMWARALGHVQAVSTDDEIGSPAGLFFSDDGRQLTFALIDSPHRPVTVIRWTPETGPMRWLAPYAMSDKLDRPLVAASGNGHFIVLEARRDLAGSPEPSNGAGTALYIAARDSDSIELVSRARHVPLPSSARTVARLHPFECELRPVLSHDGRFAVFVATDARTYPEPGNDLPQIVLRDLDANTSELISVDANGKARAQAASSPSISADGRFVVYSAHLPPTGAPWEWPAQQVFLYDRHAQTTRLVSVNASGVPGDRDSVCAVVSADGSRVAFQSRAGNLVPGMLQSQDQVLVWRAEDAGLMLLSRSLEGRGRHGASPSMSSDGRRIVFQSRDDDLVHDDTNPEADLFLYDEAVPGLVRVTANGVGLTGDRHYSRRPWLSGDGRWLAFESDAAFPGLTEAPEGRFDALVLDLQTGAMDWVGAYAETDDDPTLRGADARWPSLSADGRRVLMHAIPHAWTRTFESGPDGVAELTLMDRESRELRSIRLDTAGPGTPRARWQAVVSGNGRFVAFEVEQPRGESSVHRAGPWPMRTAMWWKPSESGWGLASFDQGSALAPIWYTNDVDGRPTWFLVPGMSPLLNGTLSGPLLAFSGRPWSSTGPMSSHARVVGDVRLHFTVDDRLRFAWRIGSMEGLRELEPFELPQRIDCHEADDNLGSHAGNLTDIWYGGPHESGWGVQLFHAGQTLALVWYTYDTDGRATYFVGVTEAVAERRFVGDLYRPRPGLPLPDIRDVPASSGSERVGVVELTFEDGERGAFRVHIGGVERSHAIERLRFGSQASVCTNAPHR